MLWKIFYEEGTYSSEQGAPEDAPGWGVAVIVMPHPDIGRFVLQAHDYYFWDGSGWQGKDLVGLMDRLVNQPKLTTRAVKIGRFLPQEHYKAICDQARADPDFPPVP